MNSMSSIIIVTRVYVYESIIFLCIGFNYYINTKDNLCKLNNELELITETHQFIKEEIQKQLCQVKQLQITVSDNCDCSWVPPVPSIRCPIIADAQTEDDFLTTLDQFEKSRGILWWSFLRLKPNINIGQLHITIHTTILKYLIFVLCVVLIQK